MTHSNLRGTHLCVVQIFTFLIKNSAFTLMFILSAYEWNKMCYITKVVLLQWTKLIKSYQFCPSSLTITNHTRLCQTGQSLHNIGTMRRPSGLSNRSKGPLTRSDLDHASRSGSIINAAGSILHWSGVSRTKSHFWFVICHNMGVYLLVPISFVSLRNTWCNVIHLYSTSDISPQIHRHVNVAWDRNIPGFFYYKKH